jgi:hypothetical protein
VITGRYGNTRGRPYVSGRLLLPSIGAKANLSFLVDTGADQSTLMPADAIMMGVNHKKLTNSVVVGGMGGTAQCFEETAVLLFDEPN